MWKSCFFDQCVFGSTQHLQVHQKIPNNAQNNELLLLNQFERVI